VFFSGSDAISDFLEHVEVVLDILEGTLVGEFLQQRFDIALGGTHDAISMVGWGQSSDSGWDFWQQKEGGPFLFLAAWERSGSRGRTRVK
jgi:hypothetical protein